MITHITNGFKFLGQTFRKTGNVLHITPNKEGVLALLQKVGDLIRIHVSAPMPALIKKLNQTLRGWANYHRHVVASEAFRKVDTYVFEQLWRMLRRRHQNRSRKWLVRKYWTASGLNYVFAVIGKTKKGPKLYQVVRLCAMGIKRHIKIKADANPYLPEYAACFFQRKNNREKKLLPTLSAREFRAMFAQR